MLISLTNLYLDPFIVISKCFFYFILFISYEMKPDYQSKFSIKTFLKVDTIDSSKQ